MTRVAHGLGFQLRDVNVNYDGHVALERVSLSVSAGAQVAVVGPNGAGKSTLFKALAGLLPLRSGRIDLDGGPQQLRLAYVPQREEIDWRFPVTSLDVVLMGRYGRLGWIRRAQAADKQAALASLERLGMRPLAGRPLAELSGGQQQRVFLARALAQEPNLLLLDEPFTGVDVSVRTSTLEVLDSLRAEGVTVLLSTHDLNLASERFQQVLLLNRKVIAFGAPDEVITAESVAQAFGVQALFVDGAIIIDQCCPPPES